MVVFGWIRWSKGGLSSVVDEINALVVSTQHFFLGKSLAKQTGHRLRRKPIGCAHILNKVVYIYSVFTIFIQEKIHIECLIMTIRMICIMTIVCVIGKSTGDNCIDKGGNFLVL